MMPLMHRAAAAPLALGVGWAVTAAGQPWLVGVGCAMLVRLASVLPNLDDAKHKGRMHFPAAVVRGTARVGYKLRTAQDEERSDLSRGPVHTVEWCALAALATVALMGSIPWFAPWAWWFGASVFVGCVSNVLMNWATPTGVPLCATYNWLVHRQVWKRHSLNLVTSDTGGSHFMLVPVLFFVSGLMVLGMLGVLRPIGAWMFGIGS
jgi:hypothetical protein